MKTMKEYIAPETEIVKFHTESLMNMVVSSIGLMKNDKDDWEEEDASNAL